MNCNLREHFSKQVISPVDFISLVQQMSRECDLLAEVGPGRVLTGLARNIIGEGAENEKTAPFCFALESEPEQDRGLHLFLAAYFVHGGAVNWTALYEDRLVRPFTPAAKRVFLTNPCERPFPEHTDTAKKAPSSLTLHLQGQNPNTAGETDRLLAEFAGISEDDLAAYLKQRSRFLGSLIRVDMENMASQEEEPAHGFSSAGEFSRKQHEASNIAASVKKNILLGQKDEQVESGESVEKLLFALIEKR
ncbi:MAG: hypothetical protein D3904_17280, partial [Candidatus Electrothrix sp. EH2]|nr:hypothetical protein [Candidatus Electrothrix sp. EH2]